MWCGYFRDDVGAATHAALGIAVALEAHISRAAQFAQQRVNAVSAEIAALIEIVVQHLPVIGSRQQVGEQAACGPRQPLVLHGGLIDDDETVASCCSSNGLGHCSSPALMKRATSMAW